MMTAELHSPWQGGEFVHQQKWKVLAISIAMVVPCFWHRQIEAGDLGSHVYNAWLAQLINKGQAPGLYIVRQWNNVLIDWCLQYAAKIVGFTAAGEIVAALCVLILFWGVFALVAAVTTQPPWFLAPCIAMLAYGYSFNMGFLNYYLSLGLGTLSLVLLWRGRGLLRLLGGALIPLALLAHPLGFLWLIGAGIYVCLWNVAKGWWKLGVPSAALSLLFLVHWYLAHRAKFPVDWSHDPIWLMNGADQLTLYGPRYAALGWVALVFGALSFLIDLASRWRERSVRECLPLPATLYAVALVAVALLPENLQPSPDGAWIGLLASRLTAITAICGICVLGCMRPSKWHLAGFAACAVPFFAFLYRDTSVLNQMEASAERLVSSVPFGTRVVYSVFAPPDSRIAFVNHFVDRVCIGRCFSYGNYEPASGQFRIRVHEDSPVVSASEDDTEQMQAGGYDVQPEDLPMKQIYQCDEQDLTKLCIRDLAPGEQNGRLGYKPAPR